MHKTIPLLLLCLSLAAVGPLRADGGDRLWLPDADTTRTDIALPHASPTLRIAEAELQGAWKGGPVTLVLQRNKQAHPDSFSITHRKGQFTLTSPTETGLLYAAYHLLRLQQTHCLPSNPDEDRTWTESPAIDLRMLNHWDNPDGTVERGYAGQSLWQWQELPEQLSPRYVTYARANASVGINGTVLNNVNASPLMLSDEYLPKVQALADLFRPYGIRVFLSINFASPLTLGGLPTADPLDKRVTDWWTKKVKDIYRLIPDFGGFLVKANSEGQPGPQDYGRTHADGANMLARILKPYGGVVMWRAFVYRADSTDRAAQAYREFQPLDGQFLPNVIVQIKNGPIDFQPREPHSPLFGAMPQTGQMAELQITQEYLGHANHLVYLAPVWREFFRFVPPRSLRAIAGVSNVGTDPNWCGHPFGQANWYAFGRLAWNPALTETRIAREWLRQTGLVMPGAPAEIEQSIVQLMNDSREAAVNYMMPLGLHHLFAWGHHYGPEPWCAVEGARPDWLPAYYHRADRQGIGFDRTREGSNALAQYPDSLSLVFGNPHTCPEEYLLWFHHLPWSFGMRSGRTLWEELCLRYQAGLDQVRAFQKVWDEALPYIRPSLHKEVQTRLMIQARDAQWWKEACLLYFSEQSGLPIPSHIERPVHSLDELRSVQLPIDNYTCPDARLLNSVR